MKGLPGCSEGSFSILCRQGQTFISNSTIWRNHVECRKISHIWCRLKALPPQKVIMKAGLSVEWEFKSA